MFSKLSDPVSGLTHFIAIILSIIGLILLLINSIVPEVRVMHIVTFSVFGAGLILLYTASTLYHWIPARDVVRERLRKIDHFMIYILIAATYTPVCLIPLRGPWGYGIFAGIWTLAITGILLEIFYKNAPRWFTTLFYVLMGWLVIIGTWPVLQTMGVGGFLWLLGGGLTYTVGAVIYGMRKPNPWPKVFGFHEIFHIFVMFGSFFHFIMMYYYVLPV